MGARPTFENELENLNTDLIKMGAMVKQAIKSSIEAFKNQDIELANSIISLDREVDNMEKAIETRCLSLLLRQQPVASDLRAISTALKMITDMERIGDNAADIANIVKKLKGDHMFTVIEDIPQMAQITCDMVSDSIKSFVNGDLELAKEVMERDNKVNSLFKKVKIELVEILKSGDDDNMDNVIDFLMIAKYLERIGDHAVNICEWVEFYKTGEHKNTKII